MADKTDKIVKLTDKLTDKSADSVDSTDNSDKTQQMPFLLLAVKWQLLITDYLIGPVGLSVRSCYIWVILLFSKSAIFKRSSCLIFL